MNAQRITELKPYERAARILCKNIAVDPDEPVPIRNKMAPLTQQFTPRWTFFAEELVHLSLQLSAMKQARDEMAGAANDPKVQS